MKATNLSLIILLLTVSNLKAQDNSISNDKYSLTINRKESSISIKVNNGLQQILLPSFTVLISKINPGLSSNHLNYFIAPRTSIRWTNYQQDTSSLNEWLSNPQTIQMIGSKAKVVDNSKGERTWIYYGKTNKEEHKVAGTYAKGTTNPFIAGNRIDISASNMVISGKTINLLFRDTMGFTFRASISLASDSEDIQIRYQLISHKDAYYSVAFTGSPKLDAKYSTSVPQEAAGMQFKQYNHLVPEEYLRLPRVQLNSQNLNMALIIDSSEMPFRIPKIQTSRFGMMLQYNNNEFRPISFAPIMGGNGSYLKKNQSYSFSLYYAVNTGEWEDMYRYIARHFYGFKDMRDNSGAGSINKTIEHTIDYMVNRNGKNYAMWHDEQKYYDYWNDRSGVFKPFSPLYALSDAIITDDEQLYRTRALPEIEFALSRSANTFAPYEVEQNGQVKNLSRALGEPYLGAAQLISLYHLFLNKTPAILDMANKKSYNTTSFSDMLALYSVTGKEKDLNNAERSADKEINKKGKSASEDFYMNLIDLYEATKNKKYLDAAVEEAYKVTTNINLSPAIPNTCFVADTNNQVPIHEHSYGRHKLWGFLKPQPFPYIQQKVPAWRVALTGLTSPAYRGEYWMNNHGQLMRLAEYANDNFLQDIARWGIVGRFGNYNGDNRSFYSLIAEDSDAIENPIWKLTYATINSGHSTELSGALIDFLISDAFQRSAGKIDFPSRSMQGTSFRVKVYGDRSGKFYNEENVQLWLPKGLLKINNKQIDYIASYTGNKLCIAFLNQSFTKENVSVQLNPEKAVIKPGATAKTWEDNVAKESLTVNGNQLNFVIPPKGITAFTITNVDIKTSFQKKVFSGKPLPDADSSFSTIHTLFGKVYSMLLSLGAGLTNAFIYTDALPDNIISATLKYRIDNNEWNEKSDAIFPYEFSIPLPEKASSIEFEFEVETTNEEIKKSKPVKLFTGYKL